MKIYCDIFLKGSIIIIKRFESSRCLILKGPGYFKGPRYHSSTSFSNWVALPLLFTYLQNDGTQAKQYPFSMEL